MVLKNVNAYAFAAIGYAMEALVTLFYAKPAYPCLSSFDDDDEDYAGDEDFDDDDEDFDDDDFDDEDDDFDGDEDDDFDDEDFDEEDDEDD
ncbi:MAG: hypothetical protein LBH50_04715 [Spirochaetaceae bacterium]|jgi:hypothetical protein|nr:hypothetical protein [Spirochaetaceae bacterium]